MFAPLEKPIAIVLFKLNLLTFEAFLTKLPIPWFLISNPPYQKLLQLVFYKIETSRFPVLFHEGSIEMQNMITFGQLVIKSSSFPPVP